MNQKFWAVTLGFTFATFLGPSVALADNEPPPSHFKLNAVGGLNFTSLTDSSNNPYAYSPSFGAGGTLGALVSYGKDDDIEVETGALFSRKSINLSLSLQPDYSISFSEFKFPLVMRSYVLPYLGLGGGVYYSVVTGKPVSTESYGNVFPNSPTPCDFGFIFNARGRMNVSEKIQAIFDVRYELGLINQLTGGFGGSFQTLQMQFLAGASFAL
jgi:hypothetical protein